MTIQYGKHNVKIVESCLISEREGMEDVIHEIYGDVRCPEEVWNRGLDELVREWQAHNLLYDLHLFRTKTKDVDLDGRRWYQFAYDILGSIYGLFNR